MTRTATHVDRTFVTGLGAHRRDVTAHQRFVLASRQVDALVEDHRTTQARQLEYQTALTELFAARDALRIEQPE